MCMAVPVYSIGDDMVIHIIPSITTGKNRTPSCIIPKTLIKNKKTKNLLF